MTEVTWQQGTEGRSLVSKKEEMNSGLRIENKNLCHGACYLLLTIPYSLPCLILDCEVSLR